MKILTSITLGLVCSTLANAAAEQPQVIDELIIQLSSRTYKAREQASQQLWQLGEQSLTQLKAIADSADPEQLKRSEILIRNIEAGVLPSTDAKVIEAIDRYRSSEATTAKLRVIEELLELGAFKQVLFLLRWEEDARTRLELSQNRQVREVPSIAAKRALAVGDIEEAIKLLRMAPKNNRNNRALAHVLKYSGQLAAEIERTKKQLPNKQSEAWLLTQLRALGDIEQAKVLAEQTKAEQALATFALLDGNPTPLLDFCKNSSSTPNHTIALSLLQRLHQKNDPTDIHEVIAELAKQVAGDVVEDGDLEYVTRIALLMGDREVGEKLLRRYSEAYALAYFNTQEYSKQEFELLGTPNPVTQAAEFELWLELEIEREFDTDLDLLAEQSSKIEELAHFYFNRGEHELSLRVLNPLLKALLEDGDDRWFQIVGDLPIYGMGELIAPLARERGNEDDTFRQLSHKIFGNVEEMDFIWAQLVELCEGGDFECFQNVLEVMGVPHGKPSDKRSSLSQLEERLQQAKGQVRVDLLVALAYAAEMRNDFEAMLEYYKELCGDRELAEKRDFHLKYQLAAEVVFGWSEIVASYDFKPESYLSKPTRLTRYAMAKRKLGENDLAETLLNQAILSTLGEPEQLNELAAVLHQCGAREEAKTVWLNLITCLDIGGRGFYYTLYNLNHQSHFAVAESNWKLASALNLAEMTILFEPSMRLSRYYSSLRSGYTATFTAGMSLLEQGDRVGALRMLEYAHSTLPGDGTLADDFFPSLMNTSLGAEAQKWFNISWRHIEKEITAYPNDHNARNTAAWLGSRSGKRLDDSLKHAKSALRLLANQPAYLDTLAEVYFAKRDRNSAVKYSNQSLDFIKSGAYAYTRNANSSAVMFSELTRQNARFKNEAFPSR